MMILAVLLARMKSERLPGKIMKTLLGKPAIYHIMKRIERSRLIQKTIIAMPDTEKNIENGAYVNFCRDFHIELGSELNVLDRYYSAVTNFLKDEIPEELKLVRLTADCPLIDPGIIDDTIKAFLEKDTLDYMISDNISNPKGFDIEVFTFTALQKAWNSASAPDDIEHVTPYIRNTGRFKCDVFRFKSGLPRDVNFSMDTQKDYELIKEIYEYYGNNNFSIDDIRLWYNKVKRNND
ncbi:MAG: acylneuraminate cytidylyltransferase [Candidatus Coatesbacteria bacterium]|nr:acylneuraminate cytidylyltransferase [Candidatus Coatesbacteria bacterium]